MSGFSNRGPQDNPNTSPYPSGPALIDMSLIAGGGGHSATTNITARAGGGQATATPLTAGINRIAVCATAGDSVALPRSVGGQIISVYNGGAAAMQVFAAVGTSDTINSVAGSTGVSLAAAKGALFCSSAPGSWFWNLSA